VTSGLTVGKPVIAEMVRLAAFEVPGVQAVGRSRGAWRRLLLGPPVDVRLQGNRVTVRLSIVARPGHSLPPLVRQVRAAVTATIERLLGLELDAVSVVVDGVGSP
jgi:uncharacterized alkaline shock family protein YloU